MRWSPARSVRVGRAAGAHPTVRRAGTPDRLRGAGAGAAGPAGRYARRWGRRNPATSPPEGLLRLVTHHLGRPRRCVADAHLDGDVLAQRAGRRRRGDHDGSHPAVDLEAVDEAEGDDVDPELGIDIVSQLLTE